MLNRIKKILEKDRKAYPNKSSFGILYDRFTRRINLKIEEWRIKITKNSTFSQEKDLWMCSLFPKKVLDIVIEDLRPTSVLDVGCGCGVSLNYFIKSGVDCMGIENSLKAINQSPDKHKIVKHNLNAEFKTEKVFDLVWCFEVIEHIHPDYEKALLKTLTNKSTVIVISAAKPGQGGHGHFNEQLPEYWISKFETLGYTFDKVFTEKLKATNETHAENILCFKIVK